MAKQIEIRHGDFLITGKTGDWTVSKIHVIDDLDSKNYGEEAKSNQHFFARLYQVSSFLLDYDMASSDKATLKELNANINSIAKTNKERMDCIENKLIDFMRK